jgi:hypothetical protein
MKNLEEIFAPDRLIEDIIKDLKYKTIAIPSWQDLEKSYEPSLHQIITDTIHFPDKPIYNENEELIRYEPRTRIALSLQKLAASRMAQFMFAIPVNNVLEVEDDTSKKQFEAVQKVLKFNHWNALNKERCKFVESQCEIATLWYTYEADNQKYGFKSKFKLGSAVFSPAYGDELYPLFSDTRDLIAFSRQYYIYFNGTLQETRFDCWTADKIRKYVLSQDTGLWGIESEVVNAIGKIPIVYQYRLKPIWEDADNKGNRVSGNVHEMEKLLSNNGEIIAYHAAPVLIIHGELDGAPTKGEANKVFTTPDANGGAEYVTWNQSAEAVKFQFETLAKSYWAGLQLPDLSFENIKGMGQVSGEARKWMLIDPHLKVGDESTEFIKAIQRELSVICAFLGTMNTAWKSTINDLEIDSEITPFIINDESATVQMLVSANGNMPVVSHLQSVKLAGLSNDPAADYIQIEKETQAAAAVNVFNPTLP